MITFMDHFHGYFHGSLSRLLLWVTFTEDSRVELIRKEKETTDKNYFFF